MIKLTDYQIAEAFQPTLRLIYKAKMRELNEELQPFYNHLDTLDIPKYTDFERWFARQCCTARQSMLFNSIEHINKIRRIKLDDKKSNQELDIQKAKAVPVENFYTPDKKKGRQITCPLHVDNSPSMILNKNNTVKCFSCGFYGDSIKLFMAMNKVIFPEAVKQLCQSH